MASEIGIELEEGKAGARVWSPGDELGDLASLLTWRVGAGRRGTATARCSRVRPSARRCVVAACGSVRRSDRRWQGLAVVEGFRTALYGCATRRADAWFELCDALLVTERLVSLPHLSLEPLHRRGHGSCTPRCAMARCRPSDCGDCWRCTCRVGRRCSRWPPRCGGAVMGSVPRVGGFTTPPRGTRRGSRSWRAGATSSSWAWSCSLTPGPRRWTCAAL